MQYKKVLHGSHRKQNSIIGNKQNTQSKVNINTESVD